VADRPISAAELAVLESMLPEGLTPVMQDVATCLFVALVKRDERIGTPAPSGHWLALLESMARMVLAQLQNLCDEMGGAPLYLAKGVATTRKRPYTAERFATKKDQATPRERKVWALWHQLHRDGAISDNSPAALNAWVARTVHVDALVWCDDLMLNTLIEALKVWCERAADARAAARARAAATQG